MKKKITINTKTSDRVDRVVANWSNERPELDTSAKEIVGRVIRYNGIIMDSVTKLFKQFDITPAIYAVLCTLRVSGSPYQLAPKQILEAVLLTSGGMSNLLENIEQKKLIERLPDPNDRRGVIVKLTPHGKKIIDAAMEAHVIVEHQLIEILDKTEQKNLANLLKKILSNLDNT